MTHYLGVITTNPQNNNIMKKQLQFFLAASLLLTGCTSEFKNEPQENALTSKYEVNNNRRTMEEITEIALRGKKGTREITHVSSILPVAYMRDTLAYIFNFANDNGFSIVSTSKYVVPELAYSDKGNFSNTNEIAMSNFIDRINEYTAKREAAMEIYDFDPGEPTIRTFSHGPLVEIKLGQTDPFNQTVQKYHPNCKVGCGPVAAATVMAYCKPRLVLNGYEYNFKDFVKALVSGSDVTLANTECEIPNVNPGLLPITWPITYNGAISAFNQLLNDLGSQMNAIYMPYEGTSVQSNDLLNAIKTAGYNVSDFKNYNLPLIVSALKNNDLIIQSGYTIIDNKKKGHAWVIDGYSYKSIKENLINDCYLYCHWGWFGEDDGYYYADVFNPLNYNFDPDKFVVITNEN